MIQGTQFGLPIMGDALVLFDHSQRESFDDLASLFQSGERITGDLGDPRSSLALSIYLSIGGRVEDENGRPILDEAPLRSTLELIQSGQKSAALGSNQNNGPTTAETWQEISKSSASWWVGWYTQLPDDQKSTGKVLPLPPYQGTPINSIADGWYWALSNPDPNQFEMTDRLLSIFMQPEFLNKAAETSDWLPVTASLTENAYSLPPIQPEPDGLNLVTISPVLRDCVLRVLTGESPELIASQTAALFE
jgi:hypothetical protein